MTLYLENTIISETVLPVESEELEVLGAKLFISEAYDNSSELKAKFENMLESIPAVLTNSLNKIYILDSYAPLDNGAMCVEEGALFVWRVKPNNDQPGLRRDILIHELAHLAGNEQGPIDRAGWEQAQRSDRERGKYILDYLNEEGYSIEAHNKVFPLGSKFVSIPGIRGEDFSAINEDWADSITYYLIFKDLEHGGIVYKNTLFRFENIWPERARIINDFLS